MNKKNMTETKGKKTEKHSKSREITGIILFAIALFILICLLSYDQTDPSFTHYVAGKLKIKNLGGIAGCYLADSLFRVFGITAFLFPLLFGVFSIKLLFNMPVAFSLSTAFGFLFLLFSSAAILATRLPSIEMMGTTMRSGGIIGKLTSIALQSYLNHIGTYILLGLVFIVSLIIVIDVSLIALCKGLLLFIGRTVSGLKTSFLIRMERNRRQKKVSVQKKTMSRKDPPLISHDKGEEEATKKKRLEQISLEFSEFEGIYSLPPVDILKGADGRNTKIKKESLIMNARLLEKKLSDFGVEGKVVEIRPGPVITMYELEPAPGVKINRITNLSDDLALTLKAEGIRIIAPIPGKAAVGIEIPNSSREMVHIKDIFDADSFVDTKYRLPIALGKDIVGNPVITDLTRMPHLLIAGTTGSGKSVSLNAMICSILFKASPDNVKMLMIDPKRLELSAYEGIPHLLHPVVVNPKKAAQVLRWAVDEMERRYKVISEAGVKSIERYNKIAPKIYPRTDNSVDSEDNNELPPSKLPYIIIIIDELADLMMVAQRNVEESLARLAQMARAAGIHLILATQRPSVDVITGIIKANFPTRISFQVSSKVDSRTILDQLGAEKLLGAGDMLFIPPGTSKLERIHGAFLSDSEITDVVDFVKKQGQPQYDSTIEEYREHLEEKKDDGEYDERYDEAVELVTDLGHASISLVQRYLKIGYNRAARIVEKMESEGVVGPADGAKPRKVLAEKLPR